MDIQKNIVICELYDLYAQFLSEKQREILYKRYFLDMSFGEIAENSSRQAVNDSLKRAVSKLEAFEDKLHLRKIMRITNDEKLSPEEKIEQIKSMI